MGAAQNQRIHAGFHQRCQVLPGHRLDDHIPLPKPAVLHQRDKQRAGLADHLHIGVQTLQGPFVSSGASGGQCGDHADLFIFCDSQRLPARGLHHAQHRQIIFLPQSIQRGGGHCAAGDQNRLQVKGPEKGDVLTGIFQKGLPGTSAVWHPGSRRRRAFTAVSPPNPESNTPIGRLSIPLASFFPGCSFRKYIIQ